MEKRLSNKEAWLDFYQWLKKTEHWKIGMSKSEKKILCNTGIFVAAGECGKARLSAAFERYRPGVYSTDGWWTKKTDL